MRLNSREERAEILVLLTTRLIGTGCVDIEILKQVDRLCRRTWPDLHSGWISWAYYLEFHLGAELYGVWARENCMPVKKGRKR